MSSATAGSSDSGSAPETTRVRHGGDGPAPSLAVVEAIAELAGVDPTDLPEAGVVLYDHVDPDALNALVAGRSDSDVDVSLTVAGYDVRVGPDTAVARRDGN
ncbi:HalOD1 output domain-containing protein [Halorubrum trapanicum]|uniref:HalOD1 output domain-containing protein n=1 Tax=Halorubrum trapanicum TaxID=29284 RepID=UPI000BBAA0F2|nr:HalOD1 output domain-containing protein [Halorubrum trapanicum]